MRGFDIFNGPETRLQVNLFSVRQGDFMFGRLFFRRAVYFLLFSLILTFFNFGVSCSVVSPGDEGRSLEAQRLETQNARNSKLRIAQIKVYPAKKALKENQKLLMEILKEIEALGQVDVVITPEGFLDGYVSTDADIGKKDMAQYAIDQNDSEYVREISQWAKRNNSWFIYGCTRREGLDVYNTALIFNRTGELVGTYDKTHLQAHDFKYKAGGHLNVFDSDFGKFGVMICADRRWPETSRALAMKGARVIFNPTYGFYDDLNLAMMRTRSYENGIYIAFTHPDQSLITGPLGEIVQNNKDKKERFVITNIDLSNATAEKNNHIADRRTDLYK